MSAFPSNIETNQIISDGHTSREAEQIRGDLDALDKIPPTTDQPAESEVQPTSAADLDSSDVTTTPKSTESSENKPPCMVVRTITHFRPSCGCMSGYAFNPYNVPRPSCGCRSSCPCMANHGFNPMVMMRTMSMPSPLELSMPPTQMSPMPFPMYMPPPMMRALQSMPPMAMPMPPMSRMPPMPMPRMPEYKEDDAEHRQSSWKRQLKVPSQKICFMQNNHYFFIVNTFLIY